MNELPRVFKEGSAFERLRMAPPPPGLWHRLRRSLAGIRVQDVSIRTKFIAIVLLPTLIAVVFYGLMASKRYVSEAEYIVRGVTTRHASGLDAILNSFGISRAADDTSAIQDFMRSRAAFQQVMERLPLREFYSRQDADLFSRFPQFWRRDTFETFYEYLRSFITVVQDPTKGLTTMRVISFRPEDSQAIAATLLSLAEERVNQMNDRAQSDAIRHAREEVALAEEKIAKVQAELTAFRNRELLVDPTSFSSALLGAVSKLSVELAQTSALIKETSQTSPLNPALPSLRAKAAALEQRIAAERKKMAGDDQALAGKVVAYEHLTLMRDLADKGYAAALAALETARQEARRQQIYIEEIVRPNLPDEDTEPRRLRSICTVFVLAFIVFSMAWILTVGAKDHAQ